MKTTTRLLLLALLCPFPCLSGCGKTDPDASTSNAKSPEAEAEQDSASAAIDHHYFHAVEKPHPAKWGYKGDTGPSHWGELSPAYALASTGMQQSPIDIIQPKHESLPSLEINYKPANVDLVYNGHTIEDKEKDGSTLSVDGRSFGLKQFHFHAPSEHTIDGKHAPMEMHLVHKDEDGKVAVIGVMIQEGNHNAAFDAVWNYLPTAENKELTYEEDFNVADMLPTDRNYFHYMGSFTTPPCTEGVFWYVLTQPVELSHAQIDKFTAIINDNNRPVQALNGRVVDQSQ